MFRSTGGGTQKRRDTIKRPDRALRETRITAAATGGKVINIITPSGSLACLLPLASCPLHQLQLQLELQLKRGMYVCMHILPAHQVEVSVSDDHSRPQYCIPSSKLYHTRYFCIVNVERRR